MLGVRDREKASLEGRQSLSTSDREREIVPDGGTGERKMCAVLYRSTG